ncbi:MAG: CoA-binding protein [Verrucomicrobiota bacterium]|nr:CoA-binding protein [Verrucomicrobiota bacterium]
MSARNVVVLGATPKTDRFAYRAMKMLREYGERPIPVNPAFKEILGETCYASISEVPEPIDTVTVYIGAARSEALIAEIVSARPRRIIFNPGAENERLAREAEATQIQVVHDCTLVMLQAGAF